MRLRERVPESAGSPDGRKQREPSEERQAPRLHELETTQRPAISEQRDERHGPAAARGGHAPALGEVSTPLQGDEREQQREQGNRKSRTARPERAAGDGMSSLQRGPASQISLVRSTGQG